MTKETLANTRKSVPAKSPLNPEISKEEDEELSHRKGLQVMLFPVDRNPVPSRVPERSLLSTKLDNIL